VGALHLVRGQPNVTAVLTIPDQKPDQDRSLGGLCAAWCETHLVQPDGPDAGDPWRFTPEQERFLLWWYAVDPAGRWTYNRGVLRRAKGWGKSPFVAAISLFELCGPCRFDYWADKTEIVTYGRLRVRYEAGQAVGRETSASWVQLSGVSERQTTNTMSMVLQMIGEGPLAETYGVDPGLTRVYTAAGGRLEPITASAPTNEGARPTFVIEDETHWWTSSNGGSALDRVARRNLGKSRDGAARCLETTNAHAVGEDSVAEKSYLAWLAMTEGRAMGSVLYDAREADPETDMGDEESLMVGLAEAYGDSSWVDLTRIRDEVWDPATPPDDSRRFYLDQIAAATDSWLSGPEWDGVSNPLAVVADREAITLGFDGSRSRARGVTDATALVACRVSDGHIWPIGVWEQPESAAAGTWTVPVTQVQAAVRAAFDRWDVVGFYADPAKWETHVAAWEAEYGTHLKVKSTREHPCEWWMLAGRTTKVVAALEQFHGAVIDKEMSHDGSYALTRHVLNARRRVTPSGLIISKEHPESARKIDAAIAAVLAWQARLDAVAAGLGRETKAANVPRRLR
jgi:hypothetical protein